MYRAYVLRGFYGYIRKVAHYYSKTPFKYENICFQANNNFHILCLCHENLLIVTT